MEEINYRALEDNFLLEAIFPIKKKCKRETTSDWVRDAVWRAHRDVITGRFYLPQYCSCKDSNGDNQVAVFLEKEISKLSKDGAKITSAVLIKSIMRKFPKVEFGAIQKLVNMSLKYILLIEDYWHCDNLTPENDFYNYRVCECDCPVDSVILGKLKKDYGITYDFTWTKMTLDQYDKVQKDIRRILSEGYEDENDNVWFDFLKWGNIE